VIYEICQRRQRRKEMKNLFIFVIVVALISLACGSTAAIPTQVVQPTYTAVPLADLDFGPILIQPGDLPAGYSGGQIISTPPAMFKGIPQPVDQIWQEFEQDSHLAGGVAVFVYDTSTASANAYNFELGTMETISPSPVQNLGEQARIAITDVTISGGDIHGVDLVFIRCNTVVYIRLTGSTNPDDVIPYAQHLDGRLSEIVCP
jgi:hypothetical protein